MFYAVPNLPRPVCAKCRAEGKPHRITRGDVRANPFGGVIVFAEHHGAVEATHLPADLLMEVLSGRANLLPGEAFRGRSGD